MYTLNTTDTSALIDFVVFDQRRPLMIWGQPGAGKSRIVQASAERHGAILVDIRLGQYDSVDLRGIPVPYEDQKLTMWLAPSTLPFEGNDAFPDDKPIFLFFDEINGASPAVQGAAYQLILDRASGEHKLKDNVYIVAAGNREGDKGVTTRMPTPLANRFTHVEVGVSVEAWTNDFAIPAGIPAEAIAFLHFREALLTTFDPTRTDKAFATPRTWEVALGYYADESISPMIMEAAMAGTIGAGPTAEFLAFVRTWREMISIKDIIKNPRTVPMPEELSARYAVTVAVSGAMTVENSAPLAAFLTRLPVDLEVLAWKLIVQRATKTDDHDLITTPEFMDMAQRHKSVFIG